jgi:hypothetical protein
MKEKNVSLTAKSIFKKLILGNSEKSVGPRVCT